MVNIIADMHKKTVARYRIDGTTTKEIETIQGVPQGDPLSPIIFNLVINPMLMELQKHKICYKFVANDESSQSMFMYADDFVCLCETAEELKKAINICKKCINSFNLRANIKKSAVMRFCSDEKLADEWKKKVEQGVCDFAWGKNGDAIPSVKEYPYLGATIDSQLNWVAHFKKQAQKYNMAAHKCKTTFKCSEMCPEIKFRQWMSVVDPTDKYSIENITLSRIQTKFANLRQMKTFKNAMGLLPSNRNSLLRLMSGILFRRTIVQ